MGFLFSDSEEIQQKNQKCINMFIINILTEMDKILMESYYFQV